MSGILDRKDLAGLFGTLNRQPPDALLAVIAQHRADPRPSKIDVGVGVYRNDAGDTPIMGAVKAAEARLLADQDTKGYLGAEGDQAYTDLLAQVAFGASASDPRITGIQTPGGTGALRLAAELIARSGRASTIWIGTPTWPNHAPIFREAGLVVVEHPYFDSTRSAIDFDAFMATLASARAGDVVLLQGCCHNPTGTAFSAEHWSALAHAIAKQGLVPLIDLAYQGLGQGLEEDAAGMRAVFASVPEALLAYSCDKNFALYRERVGALWVQAASAAEAISVRENLLALARSLWSMPPDHGAAVVRLILGDDALKSNWRAELKEMCVRINRLRAVLATSHPDLAPIAQQQGLFALLPIDRSAVASLREAHGIYMPDSARINIAGLNSTTVEPFVSALLPHLKG